MYEEKIVIIYASRYGSTAEVAELTAEALRRAGVCVDTADVKSVPNVSGYGVAVLGSGIYAHRFLPEMEQYIERSRVELSSKKIAMFGVAMRTEVVHKNGRSFGGGLILDRYCLNPQAKAMLHGRMDFSLLSEKDRAGLERFYDSIGLSADQKAERRKLRDAVSAEEADSFARLILSLIG